MKSKRCKSCRESFIPARPLQSACGVQCAIALTNAVKEKARKAREAKERAEHRQAKERIKSKGDHAREAQAAFNAWIRLRDADKGCVSCDKPSTWQGQWHASHFLSVGSAPEQRFNPDNVHKSCSICNNYLSGNIHGYAEEIERRIGSEALEALYMPCAPKRYTIEDLKEIKTIYRAKVRELKRKGQ